MSDTPITPTVGAVTASGVATVVGRGVVVNTGAFTGFTGIGPLQSWSLTVGAASPLGMTPLLQPGLKPSLGLTLTPPVVGALTLAGVSEAGGLSAATNAQRCYITEFLSADWDAGSNNILGDMPPLTYQVVPFGATSQRSAPFSARTKLIRVHVDGIACLQIGDSLAPVATALYGNVLRMAAGQTEYFTVNPGAVLAVITST